MTDLTPAREVGTHVRKEQLRAVQEVHAEMAAKAAGPTVLQDFPVALEDGERVDPLTGEIVDAELLSDDDAPAEA